MPAIRAPQTVGSSAVLGAYVAWNVVACLDGCCGSASGTTIDQLAEDIGLADMPCGFMDHIRQNPAE